MFTDTGTNGPYSDGYQAEFPETAQTAAAGYRNVERAANLDPAGGICAFNFIRQVIGSSDFIGQELEQCVRLTVDTSSQLDLFYHLIHRMIHLLLGADDLEYIQNKRNQDGDNQDLNEHTDVGCLPLFIFEHRIPPSDRKKAGKEFFRCFVALLINFYSTYLIMGECRCKSQKGARFSGICAREVPGLSFNSFHKG